MTNNLLLQVAIGVFLLLVIGIAMTIYEFTYNEDPDRKKKK